jgi:uncharacterized membrane protein
MKTTHFLAQLDHHRIAGAIREAEKRSSGQIKVFVTHHRPKDVLEFAKKAFRRLQLDRTEKRNGVLILVAPAVQKVAIFGDTAIDSKSEEAFWKKVIEEMQPDLKKAEFTSAILGAIEKVGAVLAEHFPPDGTARNELSDEVAED